MHRIPTCETSALGRVLSPLFRKRSASFFEGAHSEGFFGSSKRRLLLLQDENAKCLRERLRSRLLGCRGRSLRLGITPRATKLCLIAVFFFRPSHNFAPMMDVFCDILEGGTPVRVVGRCGLDARPSIFRSDYRLEEALEYPSCLVARRFARSWQDASASVRGFCGSSSHGRAPLAQRYFGDAEESACLSDAPDRQGRRRRGKEAWRPKPSQQVETLPPTVLRPHLRNARRRAAQSPPVAPCHAQ
jgi:hypothetical protein